MIILIQVAFVIASASDIKELIATKTETPVYENKERNTWIINIQYDQSNTIIDSEKFYTVNKENGEVKKYKSIGTLNSFNKYIEEN